MNNNKGFTLVELLVSLAIFSIILAAIFGLMLTAAKTYTSINTQLDLQTQSQLASNQIKNYIIDCNSAVGCDGNILYIINKDNDDALSSAIFIYNDGKITYVKASSTTKPVDSEYVIKYSDTPELLIGNLSSSPFANLDMKQGNQITNVSFSLNLKSGDKTLTTKTSVALRNKPICVVANISSTS